VPLKTQKGLLNFVVCDSFRVQRRLFLPLSSSESPIDLFLTVALLPVGTIRSLTAQQFHVFGAVLSGRSPQLGLGLGVYLSTAYQALRGSSDYYSTRNACDRLCNRIFMTSLALALKLQRLSLIGSPDFNPTLKASGLLTACIYAIHHFLRSSH